MIAWKCPKADYLTVRPWPIADTHFSPVYPETQFELISSIFQHDSYAYLGIRLLCTQQSGAELSATG